MNKVSIVDTICLNGNNTWDHSNNLPNHNHDLKKKKEKYIFCFE